MASLPVYSLMAGGLNTAGCSHKVSPHKVCAVWRGLASCWLKGSRKNNTYFWSPIFFGMRLASLELMLIVLLPADGSLPTISQLGLSGSKRSAQVPSTRLGPESFCSKWADSGLARLPLAGLAGASRQHGGAVETILFFETLASGRSQRNVMKRCTQASSLGSKYV